MNRKKIEEYLLKLENLAIGDYDNFATSLVLFLRADSFELGNNINDNDLEKLYKTVQETSSILDLEKEDIDNIIYDYEEEMECE